MKFDANEKFVECFFFFFFVLVTLLLFEVVVCMMCSWLLIVRAMRMTLYVENT